MSEHYTDGGITCFTERGDRLALLEGERDALRATIDRVEALCVAWESKAEAHVDRALSGDCETVPEGLLQAGTAGGRLASAADLRAALCGTQEADRG